MKRPGSGKLLSTVSTVAFSILIGLAANWISNDFQFPKRIGVEFGIVAIASALSILFEILFRLFHRSTVMSSGWLISRRKALICTISDRLGASDGLIPVIVHQLQKQGPMTCLGLVGIEETKKQANTASAISVQLAPAQDLKIKEMSTNPIGLGDARAMTSVLLRWAMDSCGIAPSQVLVDVTGGTTVMTLEAYLAAQEAGVDVEYVATPRVGSSRADMAARHPVILSSRRGLVPRNRLVGGA